MKIGLHANQLDFRGNSTVTFDYADALQNILGYDPVIISSRIKSTHPTEKFNKFKVRLYDDASELPKIVDGEKIDVLYMTKAGNKDNITPDNCKTAVHCVFDMREEHGNVYAGVSEWLAGFFKKELWVPHIVDVPKVNETLHSELGIPKDAFIFGRLGGQDQFDIPFVHSAISKVLQKRSDVWYLFLNTKPFIQHERVKFLPFHPDLNYKSKFINTCDAMIHARSDGETFGLAVAEFSSFNKPVITYDASYWWYMRAHLHMLGDMAIKYKNEEEVLTYMLQMDRNYVSDVEWDCYSKKFTPQNVIKKFDEVFLK